MSLSDTQQMMAMLAEIEDLLTKIEAKSTAVITELPRTKEVLYTFTKLERVALRWVSLGRSIAGTEDANKVVSVLTRVLIRMQMLYSSAGMIAGGLATMAIPGMTGLGLLQFAGGVAGIGMAQASMLEGY